MILVFFSKVLKLFIVRIYGKQEVKREYEVLLSLLAQKDIYGYEIIQHSRLSGDYLQYKEGMLYADL